MVDKSRAWCPKVNRFLHVQLLWGVTVAARELGNIGAPIVADDNDNNERQNMLFDLFQQALCELQERDLLQYNNDPYNGLGNNNKVDDHNHALWVLLW